MFALRLYQWDSDQWLAVGGPQSHEPTPHAAIFHHEFADAYRQFESPRPGAAGIEIEHAVARLLFGNVAMAADHNRESGGLGFEIQLRQIVQHKDGDAGDFEYFIFRQLLCPGALVDVAANGNYGRDGA